MVKKGPRGPAWALKSATSTWRSSLVNLWSNLYGPTGQRVKHNGQMRVARAGGGGPGGVATWSKMVKDGQRWVKEGQRSVKDRSKMVKDESKMGQRDWSKIGQR